MSTMQRCASCRRLFRGRAQVRGQRYCAARAQEAWRIRHPGYWRVYRATHTHYTNANRAQQARRDAARHLAKRDVSTAFPLEFPVFTDCLRPAAAILQRVTRGPWN